MAKAISGNLEEALNTRTQNRKLKGSTQHCIDIQFMHQKAGRPQRASEISSERCPEGPKPPPLQQASASLSKPQQASASLSKPQQASVSLKKPRKASKSLRNLQKSPRKKQEIR